MGQEALQQVLEEAQLSAGTVLTSLSVSHLQFERLAGLDHPCFVELTHLAATHNEMEQVEKLLQSLSNWNFSTMHLAH